MFGAEVMLGVDGHFTLLAEALEGAAKGHGSSALVAVGTGIGGAIMIDGRIWRGHNGTAGSWGWIPLSDARAHDGHGAFELMASGTALSLRAAALVPPMNAFELIEAARAGIECALREVNEFAFVLGEGLAAVASVFDPEIVIIGGGLSAAVDVLGEGIRKSMLRWSSPNTKDVPVVPATLGPTAGVVGALLAAQSKESLWL
jgi:predicted NBD/HSP70 family sugar kinase